LRVKHITQDDAHIFCSHDQIEDEIFDCIDFAAFLYGVFEMDCRFELSTRPEQKLGTDEEWDFTEDALQAALDRRGIEYTVNEGHREAAQALAERIPYRVEVDDSDETVGKRVRNAEVERIPYVVVYGDKESEASLAIRERGGGQSTKSLAALLEELGSL